MMDFAHTRALMTMGDVARHFGVTVVQVRRMVERGLVPQSAAARIGRWRFVDPDNLPVFEQALVEAGHIRKRPAAKKPEPVTAGGGG
jgi:hypothetical protein